MSRVERKRGKKVRYRGRGRGEDKHKGKGIRDRTGADNRRVDKSSIRKSSNRKRSGRKGMDDSRLREEGKSYKDERFDAASKNRRGRIKRGDSPSKKDEGSIVKGKGMSTTSKSSANTKGISIESQREKKDKVKKLLIELGKRIYNDLDSGVFPEVHIPSRSVTNIVYDKRLRQYILGDAKIVRSAKNIRHLRSFTQLIWLAFFVDKLVNEGKTSTLRDVYYSAQAFNIDFEDQAESDHIITDLEALLSLAREDFNIYPEERSSIFGDLTIEYTVPGYEGRRLNLSDHPDGYLIGPSLSSAEFIDTSAEMVLAVEKGGIFTRFVEENVHRRFKAIIVDTAGQAPRSTRYLLMRLNRELNLPVYILTDGDVYGEHIAMVIKSGSANAAHLRELTVPDAKWIGVWASDIQRYKLPTDPMTEQDVKRCHELKQDPRYQSDIWRSELELFLKMKRKSELEAFAKYGLTKITDDYLPEKLEMAKSL